ncbi:MAG: succinylglutamate desuccinylase/aspartoacylase family protein [Planctomycetes bacterium]|nr:succinylglutamate desuccinylase/aspartoacylase family protein [Planctomycetota bacterium]
MRSWVRCSPLLLVFAACTPFAPSWQRLQEVDAVEATAAAPRVPKLVWQTIGHSVEGRPLRLTRVGHGPRRVLWVGGIHGDEREGRVSTEQLPRALAAVPGAFEQVTLTILEDANPDGAVHDTRGNANGIDLNRNYPAGNFLPSKQFGQRPLDQPEAKALHDLILDERPHLVIVAHAWRKDHFINFDGPAARHAELFSKHSGYRVKPSDLIAPTPGSLGSWVGRKLGMPILTLEHERGVDPLWAWMQTREAILAVILQA